MTVLKTLQYENVRQNHPRKGTGNMKLNLNFDFSTRTHTPDRLVKTYHVLDPKISFQLDAYRTPTMVRWLLENLPIVPVPGGLAINVVAVMAMIQNWDRMSPDARREQGLRLFSEGMINQVQQLDTTKN
jgi:hypothetical protein